LVTYLVLLRVGTSRKKTPGTCQSTGNRKKKIKLVATKGSKANGGIGPGEGGKLWAKNPGEKKKNGVLLEKKPV